MHILDSIKYIEIFIRNVSKDSFIKNREKQNAVIREIEVIGEAVANLPDSFRKRYPDVQWKEIVGTRDKMIHHYFGVDLDIVWDIIKEDIPNLKEKILKIKEDLEIEKDKDSDDKKGKKSGVDEDNVVDAEYEVKDEESGETK